MTVFMRPQKTEAQEAREPDSLLQGVLPPERRPLCWWILQNQTHILGFPRLSGQSPHLHCRGLEFNPKILLKCPPTKKRKLHFV